MMPRKNLLQLFLLLTYIPNLLSQVPRKNNLLRIIHEWRFANFAYNSDQERSNAEQLGNLVPGNVAILDADYYINPRTSERRIFVTSPQFLPGIPATLCEVRDRRRNEPVMTPYPNWEDQNMNSCRGPVSVYRTFIDKCGLLWVLDSGMVETFLIPRQACRPKILIYDLNRNDELLARYEFPDGVINQRSILITLITESYQNDCRDSFAYIADVNARGLVVFDFANRNSWRIENSYFYPFPDHALVNISGVSFELLDGLFGLALSPQNDNPRRLFFHSAASIRESWVPVSVIRNASIVNDINTLRREFHHSEDIRDGQSTVEVMTDDGILIYPVLSRNALACWNSAQPLRREFQYIVHEDRENFQFISGLKLKNKTLMITSSKLQNYILFRANGTDIKYRVMIIDNVDNLLDGTPCRRNRLELTDRINGNTDLPPQSHQTTRKPPPITEYITNKPSSYGSQIPYRPSTKHQPPSNWWSNKHPTHGHTHPHFEQTSFKPQQQLSQEKLPVTQLLDQNAHLNKPLQVGTPQKQPYVEYRPNRPTYQEQSLYNKQPLQDQTTTQKLPSENEDSYDKISFPKEHIHKKNPSYHQHLHTSPPSVNEPSPTQKLKQGETSNAEESDEHLTQFNSGFQKKTSAHHDHYHYRHNHY